MAELVRGGVGTVVILERYNLEPKKHKTEATHCLSKSCRAESDSGHRMKGQFEMEEGETVGVPCG